ANVTKTSPKCKRAGQGTFSPGRYLGRPGGREPGQAYDRPHSRGALVPHFTGGRTLSHAPRSWTAHIAAALGLLSLLGVLCFHFPELLTSPEVRATYTEGFARRLLLVGLAGAFVLGTVAVLRRRNRRVAMLGVGSAAIAVMLGGATVEFDA